MMTTMMNAIAADAVATRMNATRTNATKRIAKARDENAAARATPMTAHSRRGGKGGSPNATAASGS
jgi:hypothetical protein